MEENRLTIIIPTMNRPEFVIRLLNYYADVDFEHRIAIGDSSNPTNVAATRTALDRIGNRLSVAYHEYPGLSCHAAQKALIDSVDTQYIVSLPDDDFLVPTGLDKCIVFLNAHSEYVAAHGLGVMLTRDAERPYGVALCYYPQPDSRAATAQQRVLDLLAAYSPSAFSVHRTEAFRAMWATEIADYSFGELLPCCISVVLGKIKQLDCFYLVRQIHDRRYLSPEMLDRVMSANWQASYSVFRDCLAAELSTRAGIALSEATAIVKQGFREYLWRALASSQQAGQADGGPAFRGRIVQEAARFVPGFLTLMLRSIRETHRGGGGMSGIHLALPMLVMPGTRYGREFMPIYRAVVDAADSA